MSFLATMAGDNGDDTANYQNKLPKVSVYDEMIASATSPYTVYFRQLFMTYPFLLSLLFLIYYYVHTTILFDEVKVLFNHDDTEEDNEQSSLENDEDNDSRETTQLKQSQIYKYCPSINNKTLSKHQEEFLALFNHDERKRQMIDERIRLNQFSISQLFFGVTDEIDSYSSVYRYPMFWGLSGRLQTMMARWNIFNRLIGRGGVTCENIGKLYAEKWNHERVQIVSNESILYFDVLERKAVTKKDELKLTLVLFPDVDGCVGSNTHYVNSYLDFICGNSCEKRLKFAQSSNQHFSRVIIYNREGRSLDYPLTSSKNVKLFGDYKLLSHSLKVLSKKFNIGFDRNYFVGIGWGFGSNLMLKTLSSFETEITKYFMCCISVSNPYDLSDSIQKIIPTKSAMYHNHILNALKQVVKINWPVLQDCDLQLDRVLSAKSIEEFDDLFTLKINKDEMESIKTDYYYENSCVHSLDEISVPTLLISSMDDPAIDIKSTLHNRVIPSVQKNANLMFVTTRRGGNRGFYTGTILPGRSTFDEQVGMEFIETCKHLL